MADEDIDPVVPSQKSRTKMLAWLIGAAAVFVIALSVASAFRWFSLP